MVLCFIALPVFALLGLFSVRYRELSKEAIRCLFRTVTLKPCDTGLDQRIRSKFTAKLMFWPSLARFVYAQFTILSWFFVILLLASAFFSGQGLYNYAAYGNCNGQNSNAFCVFNVVRPEQQECTTFDVKHELYPFNVKTKGHPVRGNPLAKLTIVEYGCYSCPYTKEAEPAVRQILKDFPEVNLVYHDVPLSIHSNSIEAAHAALCAQEQGKYWEYHDKIFERQDKLSNETFIAFAGELELNVTQFSECYSTNRYQNVVDQEYNDALSVGIYGTPTFFINNANLVGPQKYKSLKAVIEKEMPR
ncbi:DsbA family protein [Candidatus Woesearchaeota archaeon]|nr:DsbA family protein [Candidatus Woesearchaeota archaeon]